MLLIPYLCLFSHKKNFVAQALEEHKHPNQGASLELALRGQYVFCPNVGGLSCILEALPPARLQLQWLAEWKAVEGHGTTRVEKPQNHALVSLRVPQRMKDVADTTSGFLREKNLVVEAAGHLESNFNTEEKEKQ